MLPYAEALADFVHSCETPMTIGIQGDWGTGKTSLMNMLRGEPDDDASGLLEDSYCQVVNFETWPYSQFNSGKRLVVACLLAMAQKVQVALGDESKVDAEALAAAASQASGLMQDVQGLVGDAARAKEGDSALPGADISALMIRFRRAFRRLVQCWASLGPAYRLVLFIDDLDRIQPADALLLLESVKNFLDVPGCVFIIAVDYDVVQKGMAEKHGQDVQLTSGKAFYDKIIQLPFVMPSASYRMDGFINGLLRNAGFPYADELTNDDSGRDFLLNITLCTIGRNPRNIKRVVHYANLLERIRQRQGGKAMSRRDAQILYALICMQIAWPELFAHFTHDPTVDTVTSLQNWEFLDRMPEAERLFKREMDRERVKVNIGTFFDTLFSLLDEKRRWPDRYTGALAGAGRHGIGLHDLGGIARTAARLVRAPRA